MSPRRSTLASAKSSSQKPSRPRRLSLENLETRQMLDGEPVVGGPTFDFDQETGRLTVTATDNDDRVTATVINATASPTAADRRTLKVDVVTGGATFTWTGPFHQVRHISFDLKDGSDGLTVARPVIQSIDAQGGPGDDAMHAGGGPARLDGGLGDDRIAGGPLGDFIQGGWGNDHLAGDGGNDVLIGDPADLEHPRPIPVPFALAPEAVVPAEVLDPEVRPLPPADDTIDGGEGRDRIHGMLGSDVLIGGRGHDGIAGGTGDDAIDGGFGHDRLDGGRGSDRIDGGFGNDMIDGGEGDDAVQGGWGSDKIIGGAGNDTILGDPGDLRVIDPMPEPNSDALTDVAGEIVEDAVRPIRRVGNDLIYGGDGDDKIHGMFGNDRIRGGAGADGIAGGTGSDIIAGGDDGDRIHGGRGRDRLLGGLGDDGIVGGPQSDYLQGDAGADGIHAIDQTKDLLCVDNADTVHADDIDMRVCRPHVAAIESIAVRGAAWGDETLARPDDAAPSASVAEIELDPEEPATSIGVGGVTEISITFDGPIQVAAGDLAVVGGRGAYPVAGFRFDPTNNVATWTLARPVDNDRVTLRLSNRLAGSLDPASNDATGVAPAPSPPAISFSVIPGDVNGDGTVDRADVIDTMMGAFALSGEPGYDDARDFDGDGSITARDVVGVRNMQASALPHGASPAAQPAAAVTAIGSGPSVAAAAPDSGSEDSQPTEENRRLRPALQRLVARARHHLQATDGTLRDLADEHPRLARVLRAIRNHRDA